MARNWKTFFYSTIFLTGLLAAVGFMTIAFAKAYYAHYKIEQEINQLKKAKELSQAKKFQMMELLDYVKSSSFVEEQAHTELNYVKPGEHLLIIKTPTSSLTGAAPDNMISTSTISNPKKWWFYFFHTHS